MFLFSDPKFIGRATIAVLAVAAAFFGPLLFSSIFWSIGVMANSFRAMVQAIVGG